jgi:L-2-hydroxyglutarate oxidase LhgO
LKDLIESNKVGIRAQLYNREKRDFEMDFIVEKRDNTIHVLNAVSPAFTSAFSFAKYILSGQ